jgi:hypothetical protein
MDTITRSFKVLATLAVLAATGLFQGNAAAAPWEGYGRTYPVPRYELDPAVDAHYSFASERSFPPYRDPPFEHAVNLPNPLDEPAFGSYNVIVVVNKKDHVFWGRPETLRVYKRGEGLLYYWLISTGHTGWGTPSGYFVPTGFSSRHWSNAFDAPMFWSVFFHGGKALHSSLDRDALGDLGRPASHGCIHIEEHRAEALFHLIGQSGYGAVDKLDPGTGRPMVDGMGTTEQVEATKTLIIVGPGKPFGTTALAD